jgi:acetyl esterase/lipase
MKLKKSLLLAFGAIFLVAASSGWKTRQEFPFAGKIIRDVVFVKRGLKPLRMDVYVPPGDVKNLPAVMVIHGGGFVGGTRAQMDPLCITIANQGIVVFNVEYRLAPWVTLPAPVEDVRCGLRWIEKHGADYGADPSRLGVTGESAGGFLSAMSIFPTANQFTNDACPQGSAQVPPVKAGVLYYGVYDLIKSWDLKFPNIHEIYILAMRSTPKLNPELFKSISPVSFVHAGLPPILIQVGDKDPLYPESADLYETLKALGDPVEIQVYPGAPHAFAVFIDDPPGRINLDKTAEFFKRFL